MKNIIYTTSKNDEWYDDVDDLLEALRVLWGSYRFSMETLEDGSVEIVAEDSRFEATENALASFGGVCGVITLAIQMWIEGRTVGRHKQNGGLFGSSNWQS
ncbi:hypothetical protein BH09PAT1_BH09PAT1_6310 [soil metagenome]